MNYEQLLDYIVALPIEKQLEVKSFIEEKVREWDPDFSRLTPAEEKELNEIKAENIYYASSEINWD